MNLAEASGREVISVKFSHHAVCERWRLAAAGDAALVATAVLDA